MNDTKLRIPRVTAAALTLGACGGGGSSSGTAGTIDTSEQRVAKLAEAYCSLYAQCYPDEFADEYDSHADCAADAKSSLDDYLSTYGKDCADALLDLYECGAKLDCDEDPEVKCRAQTEALDTRCDDDGSASGSKSASVALVRLGLRIPR